jgi:hypothetical protein
MYFVTKWNNIAKEVFPSLAGLHLRDDLPGIFAFRLVA